MKFEDYSTQAITTLTGSHSYGDLTPQLMAQILGLAGESGEVVEKVKKLIRDKSGVISEQDRQELLKELSDILWYVNSVAHLLDSNISEVAQISLDKVLSRKQRNIIHGKGDNR